MSRRSQRVEIAIQQRNETEIESEEGEEGEEEFSDDASYMSMTTQSQRKSARGRGRGGTSMAHARTIRASEEASRSKLKTPKKGRLFKEGVELSIEEMVKNCLFYFLLMEHRKIPVKRSDLVSKCMNSQTKNFQEVMQTLERELDNTFGFRLHGLEKTSEKSQTWACYALVSKYKYNVCDSVTMRKPDVDAKRSILLLILTLIFMRNQSITEDLIWLMFETLEIKIVPQQQDLRKFLKTEYVNTMYLNMEERKDTEHLTTHFTWGPRAQREFSKYSILKFVTKYLSKESPTEFAAQYRSVLQEEPDEVRKDSDWKLFEDREPDEPEVESEVQSIPDDDEELFGDCLEPRGFDSIS